MTGDNLPRKVWLAVETSEFGIGDSPTVLVAASEEALTRLIVAEVRQGEYESFVSGLGDDERAAAEPYAGDPESVLATWCGEAFKDEDDAGTYTWGNEWRVSHVEVAS